MRKGITIFGGILFFLGLAFIGLGFSGGALFGLIGLMLGGIPTLFGFVILLVGLVSKSYKQCYVCAQPIESGLYERHLDAHNLKKEA